MRGDVAVGPQFAVGDRRGDLEHAPAESLRGERQVGSGGEGPDPALEVVLHLPPQGRQAPLRRAGMRVELGLDPRDRRVGVLVVERRRHDPSG